MLWVSFLEVLMPRRPKHPCSFPGCPELTHQRYCQKHKRFMDSQYNRMQRPYKMNQRYGREWKEVRNAYIKEHPFCEICGMEGKVVKAEQVHHVIPISEGGTHSPSNLMALCASCHSTIHARRGDRWQSRKEGV